MMQLAIEREQEGIQSVIDHHESIKRRGLAKRNDDLNNGRETVIPLLWEGKQVSHKKAVELALKSGKKWPSADTVGEAHMLDEFAHKYFMTGDR
jgi:hypothetical protein